ncbi:hypothetical protein [Nostoc sp.]
MWNSLLLTANSLSKLGYLRFLADAHEYFISSLQRFNLDKLKL